MWGARSDISDQLGPGAAQRKGVAPLLTGGAGEEWGERVIETMEWILQVADWGVRGGSLIIADELVTYSWIESRWWLRIVGVGVWFGEKIGAVWCNCFVRGLVLGDYGEVVVGCYCDSSGNKEVGD